jgi:hypothetical protein
MSAFMSGYGAGRGAGAGWGIPFVGAKGMGKLPDGIRKKVLSAGERLSGQGGRHAQERGLGRHQRRYPGWSQVPTRGGDLTFMDFTTRS